MLTSMASERLVVIGTSTGGLEALRTVVGALPGDFPAPICIVRHMARDSPGILHQILAKAGKLRAVQATSGMALMSGTIYVPPPDCHLLVDEGVVLTASGPRENGFRPAIDPLFRAAALAYGPRAIGVVLTGGLDDGTSGLWDIKQQGGTAVVQHPDDALVPSMPLNAIRHVPVDHIVKIADLAPLLVELTAPSGAVAGPTVAPRMLEADVKISKGEDAKDAGLLALADPSAYACPECHGVLLRMKASGPVRFRCHTGHAYTIESLLAALEDGVEAAAWNTIRALDEAGVLLKHLADHVGERRDGPDADRLNARSQEMRDSGRAIRHLITKRLSPRSDTRDG
jgi:two-component system, chemotaxis family, protein-glutamate methylesterase/glutaminase